MRISRRRFVKLTAAAAGTLAVTRSVDAYITNDATLTPARLTPEQFGVIKFLKQECDLVGFCTTSHLSSAYEYLMSDAATLRSFHANGVNKIFLEQRTTDQAWIDAARGNAAARQAAVESCNIRGVSGWLMPKQNAELCDRITASIAEINGIDFIAVSHRLVADHDRPALHYSFGARSVGNVVHAVGKTLFPNLTTGTYFTGPAFVVDRMTGGGTMVPNMLDDALPVQMITDKIRPGDFGLIAYGAAHFSGMARDRGQIDMVRGLQNNGQRVATINLNESYADRADHYRSGARSRNFRPPDIEFFIGHENEPAVVFNNPELQRRYASTQLNTAHP